MSGTPGRWGVPPAASYARHCWPGEVEHLVFVPASGELHLLTELAVSVLVHLSDSPSDAAQLAAAFRQPDETVEAILRSLDRLGLVAPCR